MMPVCEVSPLDVYRSADVAVYGAALVVWVAAVFFGIQYVHRNRSRQVISRRQPFLMILWFASIGLFVAISFLRKIVTDVECSFDIPLFVSYVVMANVLIIRMYYLYLSHRISTASVDYYNKATQLSLSLSEATGGAEDSFISTLKNARQLLTSLRKKASRRVLVSIILIKSLLEIVPIIVLVILFRERVQLPLYCAECARMFIVLFLATFFPSFWDTSIYLFFFYKVWKSDDSLGLKSEAKIYVFLSISGVFLAGLVYLSGITMSSNPKFDPRVIVIIGAPVFVSSLWLYYTLYALERVPTRGTNSISSLSISSLGNDMEQELLGIHAQESLNLTLDDILSKSEWFELFKQYLQREFSVENILFWKDVQEFKKTRPSQAEASQAVSRYIFETYIPDGAVLSINISHKVRVFLTEVFQSDSKERWNPEVFDEALTQIERLMREDSYPRFKFSPLFQKIHI